ncbi:TonB-dependent receptor domain-containing protein [Phenylobacterium sp.]|uniref:TonB-dependent receptor domain-containing protein n=1 Tax=Phenylobacterium sp. TaxID=1871053 RepID=UPI0035658AED
MKTQTIRGRLLASSTICGAAFLALSTTHAVAADAAAGEVSEVVVTGSRIPQPNLTSVSPIQVVTDQEIKLQGKTDVIDLINNLPQNFQNAAVDFSGTSNPLSSPGGVSTADLRGLGPQRTLVLVDGRRLGIGDANTGNPNPAPDLNQIPAALVDRVEVLTGGASATYGSDAVAGVVNFVMKHNFQGVQIDGQVGMAQHSQNNEQGIQGLERAGGITVPKGDVWDGRSRDLSILVGTNGADDRMNITAYLAYHKQDPVSQSTRDYSACQIRVRSGTTPFCNGSPNSNQFFQATGSGPGIDNVTGFAVVGRQFIDYAVAPTTVSPPLLFNSNPFQYLQHDDERYSAGFFSHYELSKNLDLYGEFSYMNDRSTTAVAPSGLFQGSGPSPNGGFLVNCNNPLLSAQQANTLCSAAEIASGANVDLIYGRRNIEGGPRASTYEHENYRAVVGARGDVPDFDGWKYDAYAQYYYTTLFQSNENYLSNRRIQNALQVVNVGGTPTCVAKVNGSDPGCIPYNIFTEGGVTADQVAYLNSTGTSYGKISETIVEATLTGELGRYGIKSPWADDGVGVSVGIQDRRQTYNYQPDANELSNDLSGFGGAGTIVNASLGVTEGYGEFRAPIVQHQPFFDELTLDGGYRYSHYSNDVTADTYKIGLQWAPVQDIKFRASFNRAIRAPNILELFNPQSVTNQSEVSVDPCAPTPTGPATATLAQCMNTGVTAAQYGNGGSTNHIIQCPSGQCAVLNGGNTKLTPERANTYSVGFTVRPSFLEGFIGSVDYFSIKLDNTISKIPLAFTLNQCLTTGNPVFCSGVVRNPSGLLFGTSVVGGGYINGTAVNIGAGEFDGVDLQATYNMPLSKIGLDETLGSLQFNFIGSALMKATTTPTPGAHTYDCAGLYGATCQTVNPKWRHTLRASWQAPWDLLLSAQWRYIGKTTLDSNSSDPTLTNGAHDTFDGTLRAVSYLDLAGIWKVNKALSIRAGVNNVFDKDPQILNSAIVGTGLPNAYPTYDFLGRAMFVGFTANF